MRKALFTLAAIAAAASFLASCQKAELIGEQAEAQEITSSEAVLFTCTLGADTKTTLGEGDKVLWAEGDEILINGARFTLKSGAGQTSAAFALAAGETAPAAPFKAVYPAKAASYAAGAYTLDCLAGTRTLATDLSISPMYAESENNSLQFCNLCNLIEFTIDNGTTGTLKITADQNICGTATIAAADGKFQAAVSGEGASNTVTLALESSPAAGKFLVAMPAGEYTNLNFEIRNDSDIWTKTVKAGTLKRGYITGVSMETEGQGVHHGIKMFDGLYFADRNIGAETTEDRGYFFFWADPTGGQRWNGSAFESAFTQANYKQEPYGWEYKGDITVESGFDSARQNWGAGWRMMTFAEAQTITNEDKSGKVSYVLHYNEDDSYDRMECTSASTGKTLIIPFAGSSTSTKLSSNTYFWTSSEYNINNANRAYAGKISSSNSGKTWTVGTSYLYKYIGAVVRPVCE